MLSIPQWSSGEFPFAGRAGTPSICALTGRVDPHSMMCDYELYFCQVLLLVWHWIIVFIFSKQADGLFSLLSFLILTRAATDDYVHCRLIGWLFFSMNWLVVWHITCQNMVKRVNQCFLKAVMECNQVHLLKYSTWFFQNFSTWTLFKNLHFSPLNTSPPLRFRDN